MLRSHLLRAAMIGALAIPVSLSAQTGSARIPAACTYDSCALRVEPAILSAPRLLRGRSGEQVGSLGAFGGGVDVLLDGPDSAAVYARRYVSNIRPANALALLGTVAFVVAAVRSHGFGDTDNTDRAIALTGAGLALISIPFNVSARRSLSRAVWFYNAALPNR